MTYLGGRRSFTLIQALEHWWLFLAKKSSRNEALEITPEQYRMLMQDLEIVAKHPAWLLKGSPVSSTLTAAVMNGKYVNAVTLYRLNISRQYGTSLYKI